MPYIPEEARGGDPETPGMLNYVITTACLRYIRQRGQNYITLNEVIGVLECAKLEMYRRRVAPYEDEAIQRNGDVY